jgi:hypothetical protein
MIGMYCEKDIIPGKLEEAIFLKYSSYIVTEKITHTKKGKEQELSHVN